MACNDNFDEIIGYIEDILIDDSFINLLENFKDKYYQEFENTEENKFIYTDIFKKYIETVESYLIEALKEKVKDFKIDKFLENIVSSKGDLEGEIFEFLLTFTDFLTFKEEMLHYKKAKNGDVIDLSSAIEVISLK